MVETSAFALVSFCAEEGGRKKEKEKCRVVFFGLTSRV